MQCISLPELDIFLLCVASCVLFAVIYVKIKNYKKPIPPFEEHKIEFMEDRVVSGSVYYSTNHNGKYVPGSLSRDREEAYRKYENYVTIVNNKQFLGEKVIESTTVKRPI